MLRVLEAAGAILLGGVSALSGRYLGSGRIDKTRGVCSLGMAGALVRMLASVFIGEENRESVLSLIWIVFSWVMLLVLCLTAVVVLLAPKLAMVFFPDTGSEVYRLSRQLFAIYGYCIPATLVSLTYSGYFQAAGHRLFGNLISVTDGFVSMVIPAVLLAPWLGALGVWLSFPIGLAITLGVCMLYAVIRNRRWPRKLDEWLLLPADFGASERLVLELRVACKTGAHAGLCLEEMAGNIVRHGFHADRKAHIIEVRVVLQSDDVVLRVKDDCTRTCWG